MDQKEKVLKNLTVTETDEFNPTFEVEMTTASELAKLVDTLFGRVFNDYHRCNLVPTANQFGAGSGYELNLCFRPIASAVDDYDKDNKIPAFVPISASLNKSSNKIYNELTRVTQMAKAESLFTISQSASEILRNLFMDPYVISDQTFTTDPNPTKYMKRNLIGEQNARVPIRVNQYQIVMEYLVLHLDINKVLQLIKGETNEKGERVFYNVQPRVDIRANIPNSAGMVPIRAETIIDIMRLNGDQFDNFSARVGASQRVNEVISPVRIVR